MDDLYFLKLIKLRIELEFPTEGCEFFYLYEMLTVRIMS